MRGGLWSFSFRRFWAMVSKEFVQMRRDRLTFAMMLGIPVMQMVLFGFAINADPRHLPTAVLSADQGIFSRSILAAMQNSDYFQLVRGVASEDEAEQLIELGEVQFVLSIPEQFSRKLIRGERPALLLTADATDPAATSNALSAFRSLAESALARDLEGPLRHLRREQAPLDVIIHPRFNPEGNTQYNIVPGLMGVVLTMTLVIITALAITRERERGTMENLLSTPVRPLVALAHALLAGPESPILAAPLPPGVEVRSIHLDDTGVAFVDLVAPEGAPPPPLLWTCRTPATRAAWTPPP
jgi:ABC-2 type transport system permease protein